MVLGALGIAIAGLAIGTIAFESHLFPGDATATRVTITGIERIAHADENSSGYTIYTVRLPDGSHALFGSPRTHAAGTRLVAMVSRGRLTGRPFVTAPYSVVPAETP
jgi:hypothetical protein